MSIFSKEALLALSAIGLGLGGVFMFKKFQEQPEVVQNEKVLENLVKREKIISMLQTIRYRMKYYHRLAISIFKQLEGTPEKEREKSKTEFFEKFIHNDYQVLTKNISQYEYGILYEDFIQSLEYYINKKEEEIINLNSIIEKEFLSNLNGNKTLLAPSHLLLSKIDKETAKEIFKEIYCYKFYQIMQQVKEYQKQNQKIDETREYFSHFVNIYTDMDQKLSQFLLVDTVDKNERNFNCFFELIVYYCENDLQYSKFVREMEIQSILLYIRIQQQNDDIDYKYIKNQFQHN